MPSPTGKRLLPLGLHPGSCAVAPALSHLAHSTSAKRARSPFERRRAPERVMYPEKREPQPKVAVLVIDGGKWTVPTLPDTDRLHSGSPFENGRSILFATITAHNVNVGVSLQTD